MTLGEFLTKHATFLKQQVEKAFSPFYDPENEGKAEKSYREKLKDLIRKPFPKQTEAVLALAKGFIQGNHRGLFLVGEMGIGKTLISLAVSYLICPPRSRTIIMCPGHLVRKWMREIKLTIPGAKIVNLNNQGLKELLAIRKTKPEGREFYVIGKERAKMHYVRKPAFYKRQRIISCPTCGAQLVVEPSVRGKRPKCEDCKNVLWEADNSKLRRYAKAEFIKRYFPRGSFHLFIGDEAHIYKGGDTAQGQAFANLAISARRSLCLTGTLMGGYATNLFYLLFRIVPRQMREVFSYVSPMKFAETYGVIERIEKESADDANFASIGRRSTSVRVVERPGISPMIFTDLLLERSIFVKLEDVSKDLPPYTEEVVEVDMGDDQKDAYKTFERELRSQVTQALARGDKGLLGAMLQSLLGYPDGARRGEIVRHPRDINPVTGERMIVCSAPKIDEPLLPKEEKLLEVLKEQISEGRKVIVCLEHTGRRDLIPDLVERCEDAGIRPMVLRQNSCSADKREKWLQDKMKDEDPDILITNPRLIETGLDLIEYPTIVYFQTGYSVFTLRQSSRRSWRIGQDKPVKVFYMVYQDTMQDIALSLMANKMQVALAVEGDLSDKGLMALAEGESSILIQMAKSLIGEETASTAGAAWTNYSQAMVQSNERLDQTGDLEVKVTQEETTTTETQGKETEKTVTVTFVKRGIVTPYKGYAVAKVNDVEFTFCQGKILWNRKLVGNYTKSGEGNIGSKPIVIQREGQEFVLMEKRLIA